MSGKKAIILSGGGAKGAWGVGVVKALMENGRKYDIAIGTSTGSLMAPFILADDIAGLEKGYTTVSQNDIFSKNPFNKKGGINMLKAVFRILNGKKTLGESENLKKTIDRLITDEHFNKIEEEGKLLGATVSNFNMGISEVKTNLDYPDAQMRNWIWASSNNPIFMSNYVFTEKDGQTYSYTDGGITNYANVEYVLKNRPKGLTEIDVIFHNTREVIRQGYDLNSKVLARIFRILDMFSADVNKNDLVTAKLTTDLLENDVLLTIYYMRDLDITTITTEARNSLLFDEARMQTGVMRGYQAVKKGDIDVDGCMIMCETGYVKRIITP